MSEEKRRKIELNDAQLEGVSGGASEAALARAKEFCADCNWNREHNGAYGYCDDGSAERLAPYVGRMQEYYECTFFRGPVG